MQYDDDSYKYTTKTCMRCKCTQWILEDCTEAHKTLISIIKAQKYKIRKTR